MLTLDLPIDVLWKYGNGNPTGTVGVNVQITSEPHSDGRIHHRSNLHLRVTYM